MQENRQKRTRDLTRDSGKNRDGAERRAARGGREAGEVWRGAKGWETAESRRTGRGQEAAEGRDFGTGRSAAEGRKARAAGAGRRPAENRDRGEGREAVDENRIEGRNAVIEAYRAGRTIEKLFLLEGPAEGAMQTVLRLARDHHTPVRFLSRQRLDQMSVTGKHQGVIAQAAAFHYSELEDLFAKAAEKGEDPFFILLDQIEDPHNLGAIIRTANLAGAHGVIILKDRAAGLTATALKASAGAIHYTPVVKVTNLARTMEELKKRGLWFVCADMDGTPMTKLSMTGPIGLVIGAEGSGVSRLVMEKCDMTASIPMKGEIDSLNASVAAGVLRYEILRQRG